jgi:hypothetical protein
MTKQRGEFTATVTTKIYPSSPDEYRRGEVRRGDGPTIYISSRKKKDKTEQEMRDDLKTGREKSLQENSNIEKREQNARIADAQLSYFQDRYGENDRNRPRTID